MDAWTRQLPHFFSLFVLDKSRNLSKFVSGLLSASVERVGVSRMRDFHRIGPLGRFDLVVAVSVCQLVAKLSPFHAIVLRGGTGASGPRVHLITRVEP